MCKLCRGVRSKYPISTAFPSLVFSILKNANLSFLNATLTAFGKRRELLCHSAMCSAQGSWIHGCMLFLCLSGTPASWTAQPIQLNSWIKAYVLLSAFSASPHIYCISLESCFLGYIDTIVSPKQVRSFTAFFAPLALPATNGRNLA